MFICGGDYRSGPRDECPDPIHDYPLPSGYVDFFDAAQRRAAKGWAQVKCSQCRIYGWRPGRPTGDPCDQRVPATTTPPPTPKPHEETADV